MPCPGWTLDFLSEVPLKREATHPCLKGPGFLKAVTGDLVALHRFWFRRSRGVVALMHALEVLRIQRLRLIILPMFHVEPHPRVQVWM